MTDELKSEAIQAAKTLEQGAEKLALKSKDELLAAAQKTFGPGITQIRKGPRWHLYAIALVVLIALVFGIKHFFS